MPTDLLQLQGLSSGPALVFSLVFGAVLSGLAYLFVRPYDENRAFWIGCSTLLVAMVVGLALGTTAVAVMGILSGIGGIVFCARHLRRRTLLDIGLVLGAVWICYVAIPYDPDPDRWFMRSALTNRLVYDDKDLLEASDFLTGMTSGAPDLKDRPVNYWKQLMTRDFAQLAQKAAGAPGLNPINYFRPVIASSYAMDTHFWAEAEPWEEFEKTGKQRSDLTWISINPFGYHFFNVLVHALNSLLLFLVVRSLSRNRWLALFAGVLFAAHPIHTETVTWIAGRTDGIGTAFFLSAFWLYLRYRHTGSMRALAGGAALFMVGIFAKEAIAPLGLVLAAYEVILFVARRKGGGDLHVPPVQSDSLERTSSAGAALGIRCVVAIGLFFVSGLAVYFMVKNGLMGDRPALPPQADSWFDGARGRIFPIYEIWLTFQKAAFWYLAKCLWPWPLEIYPNVPWASMAGGLGMMLAHGLIVGGAVALLILRPRARIFAFGVLGFYLCLAPVSCVFKFARLVRFSEDIDFPVSERFVYIPSIFVVVALAWVFASLLPRLLGRGPGRALGGVILVVMVGLSAVACQKRAVDWHSDYHLFESGVRTNPESVRMSNNFGFELMQDWDIKRARQQLMRCTQLQIDQQNTRPPMPTAYQNLGHSYYMQGEFGQAVDYYRRSFQFDPKNAVAANNLGALMGIFGSITMDIRLVYEGLQYYHQAVQNAPNYVYAQSSFRFMRNVYFSWDRYLKQKSRKPPVVLSFGNSFLFAARSISDGPDPKYLQSMQILDSGLRNLPSQEEMNKIFAGFGTGEGEKPLPVPVLPPKKEDLDPEEDGAAGSEKKADDKKDGEKAGGDAKKDEREDAKITNPRELRRSMEELFTRCFESGVSKYQKLIRKHVKKHGPEAEKNAALNFLLGEVYRVGARRTGRDEHRKLAEKHLRIALEAEPEHVGATRGLTELLRARGAQEEAVRLAEATVAALLVPAAPWEESVPEPIPAPLTRQAFDLCKEIAAAAASEIAADKGPEAEAHRKMWRAFLERTARRCLAAQKESAETMRGGQDSEAWNNLGYFHIKAYEEIFGDRRMLDAAVLYLDRSIGLDPNRQGPAINKIRALRFQGRLAEAEALRRTMQQRFPGDVRFSSPSGAGQPGMAPGGRPMPGPRPATPRQPTPRPGPERPGPKRSGPIGPGGR